MLDDVIKLIKTTYTKDENGVQRPQETMREVFCRVGNTSMSEFFEGGRNGLNPEYRMHIFHADYDGERICEYQGNRYAIYRTYRANTDTLELYVERQGGVNG